VSDQPGDETNPNATDMHPEPTQPTSGFTHDTTGEATTSPLMAEHISATDDAVMQIGDLAEFLGAYFPEEIALTNRPVPERPVETAIRLLKGLATRAPSVPRCGQGYCNQILGHEGEHGMVNYG
jgi:hypothetical protein